MTRTRTAASLPAVPWRNRRRPAPAGAIRCKKEQRRSARFYRQFGAIVDDIGSWTGRCTVLYDGHKEQQIAFFGWSGD
jgi:hypothetical protein